MKQARYVLPVALSRRTYTVGSTNGKAGDSPCTRLVDRHIRNLRAKLQNSWRRPRYIATIPGQGYRFIPTDTGEGAAPPAMWRPTGGDIPVRVAQASGCAAKVDMKKTHDVGRCTGYANTTEWSAGYSWPRDWYTYDLPVTGRSPRSSSHAP
jgi:hypothetical protein